MSTVILNFKDFIPKFAFRHLQFTNLDFKFSYSDPKNQVTNLFPQVFWWISQLLFKFDKEILQSFCFNLIKKSNNEISMIWFSPLIIQSKTVLCHVRSLCAWPEASSPIHRNPNTDIPQPSSSNPTSYFLIKRVKLAAAWWRVSLFHIWFVVVSLALSRDASWLSSSP